MPFRNNSPPWRMNRTGFDGDSGRVRRRPGTRRRTGGSEWPVCFACFLDDLAAFDCRGYATFAELIESRDHWEAPCQHLTVWVADPSLRDVVRAFEPGAGVPGLPGSECIPTPGHTPGHVSFFRPSDRVLITGDALVTVKVNSLSGLLLQRQGLAGPPWYTTWSSRAAKELVALLARLEPNAVVGGHGPPMTGAETAAAVRVFAERFSGRAARPNARSGS